MFLFLENISQAFASIKANKTRAALTMLGIIIGITAVITILTVGSSMTAGMTETMSSRGANQITVGVSPVSDEHDFFGMSFKGVQRSMKKEDYLTTERLKTLCDEMGGRIAGISLNETVGQGTVKRDGEYANVNVGGYNDSAIETENIKLLSGRLFYPEDYEDGRKVCLLSDYFCNNLYAGDTEAVLGKSITVSVKNKYLTYTVIGVYKYEADSRGFSFETSEYDTVTKLYIPLNAALAVTHNSKGYQRVSVLAASIDDATALSSDISKFLNGKFYRHNENYQVNCFTMQSIIEDEQKMMGTISMAISAIAGISLIVGGIGVMNTMLVSVTERTREIGTRKALGAKNSSILTQFVIESIALCLTGGVIGIILGMLLGMVVSKVMGYTGVVDSGSVIGALLFSMGIGVFFGFYPARKAARMNPIDALRYE